MSATTTDTDLSSLEYGGTTTARREGVAATLKNGQRLRYVQQGPAAGSAVILMHGYSDSSFSFSRVLPLLPPSMRVIALDHRGHGESTRAQSYSMDVMAADVIELMNALHVSTATLVGHSMSSFVARRAAVLAPERITGLVLVGAGLSSVNDVMRDLERVVQALEDPVPRAFVHEFQYSCVATPLPVPFMEKVIEESLKLDAATWKAVLRGLMSYVAAEASIHVPVLVLGGDRDAVFSVAEQRALVERLAHARLHLFEGVGHTPHWEDPQRFASELLSLPLPLPGGVRS